MRALLDKLQKTGLHPSGPDDADQSITMLFLAASPMVLWFFRGGIENTIAGVAFIGLLMTAFWQLSEGLRAEQAYIKADVAKRPERPRKLIGAALLGVAAATMSFYQMGGAVWPPVIGALACLLTIIAFGIDPLRDKGMDTPEQLRKYRRRVLSQNVRVVLDQLMKEVVTLGDKEASTQMRELRETSIRILVAYEADPERLKDLKKYLRNFLEHAAGDVAEFVPAYHKNPQPDARQEFLARLASLKTDMEAVLGTYVHETQTDVDQTIDKLLDRMAREAAA